MRLLSSTLGLALLLAPFTAAHALRAADMPPPAPEAVRAANPKPGASADAVRGVREGEITAVTAAGDRVQIDGAWFSLVDGQTRVYRQGRAAAVSALAKGQRVSFSTVNLAGDAKTLGVVYVQ